jgi:Domain of unknown function (DUF1963)
VETSSGTDKFGWPIFGLSLRALGGFPGPTPDPVTGLLSTLPFSGSGALIDTLILLISMEYGRLILDVAPEPIREPVTKFGGLPVWVEEPRWPRSAATGEQMLFIGQVVIARPLFPVETPHLAYLFITENPAVETWDPKSGENAVIIQSISTTRHPTIIEGPSLREFYWVGSVRKTRAVELSAVVKIEPVPPEIPYEEVSLWDRPRQVEHYNALEPLQQRIGGGSPDWIQGDEAPEGWRLLLQMRDYPRVNGKVLEVSWNFGTGSCYVLISPDCSRGILLWQC